MASSEDERREIRLLLEAGFDSAAIAAQLGVSVNTVAGVRAQITRRRLISEIDASEIEENAGEAAFGLERDLQLALRRSIEQLEPGLTIIDDDKEKTVASGRIDITARDGQGITVAIELKVGTADRDAVGQLLSYMGDLMDQDERVRGILVARNFSRRAISAARAAAGIRLLEYGFQFTFRTVGEAAP